MRALFDLHQSYAMRTSYTLGEFERASTPHKLYILKSLYANHGQLLSVRAQIQDNIKFLSHLQQKDLQETGAKVELETLEQRVVALAQKLEAGEDVLQEWRGARQKISQLKNQYISLNADHYAIFTDSAQLCAPLENVPQARKSKPSPLPTLQKHNSSIFYNRKCKLCKARIKSQQQLKNQRENVTTTYLKELQELLKLDAIYSLEEGIKQARQAQQEKQAQLTVYEQKFQKYQELLKTWVRILNKNQATQDYKDVEDTFKSCCNVVAITSNSGSKEFDGLAEYFGVGIIDEVSKSTPLALLMPLMRAQVYFSGGSPPIAPYFWRRHLHR